MFVYGYPTLLDFGGKKKKLGSAKFWWVKKYLCRGRNGRVSRGSWLGRVSSPTGNDAAAIIANGADQNTTATTACQEVKPFEIITAKYIRKWT